MGTCTVRVNVHYALFFQIPYSTVTASADPVIVGTTVNVECNEGFELTYPNATTMFTCDVNRQFVPDDLPECQGEIK